MPAGLDEVVVRRYAFQAAAAGGQQLAVAEQAPRPKPPSCALRGSMLEMTVQLQHQPVKPEAAPDNISAAQHYVQQQLAGSGPGTTGGAGGAAVQASTHLPASAEAVVASLQQLLDMMQALAPPVQLLMRLHGVLMQVRECSWKTKLSRGAGQPSWAALLCQHWHFLARCRHLMAACSL